MTDTKRLRHIAERLRDNEWLATNFPILRALMNEAADEIEQLAREGRHGAHLFATAKSLGWKDDGEGALEFIIRRSREVAIEDCREDQNAEDRA